MAIRCRCPPENSCGKRLADSGSRPTSTMTFASLSLRCWRVVRRATGDRNGSVIALPILIRGSTEDRGSWNTIAADRRSSRIALASVRDFPLKRTVPESGCRSAIITLSRVDFPAPDPPTRPSRCPSLTCSETPSRALVPPLLDPRCRCKSSTSI